MFAVILALALATAVSGTALPQLTINFGPSLGRIRVTSYSDTLLRVEPEGPQGFEDRTTFAVVDRESFPPSSSVQLVLLNQTSNGEAYVKRTPNLDVIHIQYRGNGTTPTNTCVPTHTSTDANDPTRSSNYPNGAQATNSGACCALCKSDPTCNVWIFAGSSLTSKEQQQEEEQQTNATAIVASTMDVNCWPL